jgi:DnaJ-domain-containing protein 1
MQFDSGKIDIARHGDLAKLSLQVGFHVMAALLTHPQLDQLSAELTQFSALWRASTMPDFYAVLGLDRLATQEEIKKAYRKLAKTLHPDLGAGNEAKLKEVNAAYEVLSDPNKRKEYDQQQMTA